MRQLFLLVLLLPLIASAQTPKQLVSFGQPDSIYSDILKEKRELWIYSPNSDTSFFAKAAYPVLYVLDGDAHFSYLQTIIRQMSENGVTALPQMIIVGIASTNGNRMHDLTPTVDPKMPGSGGGEQFTAFIEKELIPYIDNKYPTAPYRVYSGHSLGGLMVINTLLHHPSLFNAYIASDPSISWNDSRILQALDSLLEHQDFNNKRFYLAIAHTMNASLDTIQVKKDNTMGSIHTSAILQLASKLKQHPRNHLNWAYNYYPNDYHNSIPLIAQYDGLRTIFRAYWFPTYLYPDKSGNTDSLRALITTHYKTLSKEMGYNVLPYEWEFNSLGYHHLSIKNYAKSQMFFELNIAYFPASYNTYDSMGDYYMEKGDSAQAVIYWKKSLALRHVQRVQEKVDKVALSTR
ncbi:alpha/beta hydrolase-fold protein [Chitinophaga pinensis]|uniref:Esterase n=1 Tax=Chitinophaga pinensis (strain ATCC 43595 / DSM 2588 / LMG 13176 / NBRC 15968 / NCIMB 11800 / UQM 2034) TaxID=485918 RepID=A0A979G9W9_CHIPD|nr:alpha/beta hydrolase-fold protein [Chitinophaga pinensis]ACU63448.1 putative esterase [Chitinophaga pinensis DSM 2588]